MNVEFRKMRVLELFSGTASFSNVFKAAGHEVLTLDNNPRFNPDYCMSILDFSPEMLPPGWKPSVIWASPPCPCFSVMRISAYWDSVGRPKNHKTFMALAMVKKALEIISDLKPEYWFLENPVGMLRKQYFMKEHIRKTVTYCQYGERYQKPTDIFTNAAGWIPKKKCNIGDSCHEHSPRGSAGGVQNWDFGEGPLNYAEASIRRAVVPEELCIELYNFVVGNAPLIQDTLI